MTPTENPASTSPTGDGRTGGRDRARRTAQSSRTETHSRFGADRRQSGSYPETLELYRKRTGATASVSLDLRSSLSIQPFEGSRFVRGGRYGISIDFSSEVVEKKSICGASFKSKFIDLTMKPRLTIASS